eukprot:TRINITY_DN121148_c0_g1_i1.p1 TRINITY_DN121148_c0_g1~~TRINITY_DN121148_c0_g1_i1.p1  ORF type:complete len:665 (-),score=116.57 TRINITY_DN121148_c0_g1_i1:31-2025(-)
MARAMPWVLYAFSMFSLAVATPPPLAAVWARARASASQAARPIGFWAQAEVNPARPSTVNCTWKIFHQPIDHFGTKTGTFPQRYCVYDKWWKDAAAGGFKAADGAPGPILFYTGNESPLEEYVNNTGLMWELGPKLGALLVWAEHRYEPLSHPDLCGQGTQNCFAYCTTAQALMDFATLLQALRAERSIRAPAVAFGGSYGGMLTGWFRMKYPHIIDGAIAASAPIWQLASLVEKSTLDWPARAVTRGVSAAGGSPDQCAQNIKVAWPLLEQVGASPLGLKLMGDHINSCKPLESAREFTTWANNVYFLMAEGNYPYPSTYITYAVGPGDNPLPAWPMRVACEHLSKDFGIRVEGSLHEVNFTASLGDLKVSVDWASAMGNGANLTEAQIRASGALELADAIAKAAGVWYNVTKDQTCWDVRAADDSDVAADVAAVPDVADDLFYGTDPGCAACPPCDGCPACGVSNCTHSSAPCSYNQTVPKTFSWDGICCNDDLSQIDARGLGRDVYWPPTVPDRNYSVETIVGSPPGTLVNGCGASFAAQGLLGAPAMQDPWSRWMTEYYGRREDVHKHRNIVWSNGALDPWSGQGVYPPDGGPEGPMVQPINADGSQIALVLDLGAHHLDLMFSDPRDPPCAKKAREIEEKMIRQWVQEAYDQLDLRLFV